MHHINYREEFKKFLKDEGKLEVVSLNVERDRAVSLDYYLATSCSPRRYLINAFDWTHNSGPHVYWNLVDINWQQRIAQLDDNNT